MTPYRVRASFALFAMFSSTAALAAAPEWRVVLSATSPTVVLPQLPAETYSLADKTLSDSMAATLSFDLSRASGRDGPWYERAGELVPMAELGVLGATGPGRLGAQSTEVFRLMGKVDSNAQDQRVFGARAGDPVQAISTASYGVWVASESGNREIARTDTDGPLGPGMGSEWSFRNDADFANFARLHALPDGAVLLDTLVRPPPGQSFTVRQALVRHTPGLGNVPCALMRSSNPAWSPGVLPGDYFDFLTTAASSPRGEIYAGGGLATQIPSITTRRGIWQFCNGVPQIKALSADTGTLGPNIPGSSNAVFQAFAPILAPSSVGSFYFSAEGSPAFKGAFYHANGQNRPVLLNATQGVFGPNVPGFQFALNTDFEPHAAGRFGLIYAKIQQSSGANERFGLWRLRPDAPPEPILIIGDTGAYAPAAGRLWQAVSAFHVLENGVVIALAATSTPPSPLRTLSLWRFRPGRAPEELLKSGDLVRYPTAAGLQMRSVRGVSDTFVSSGQASLQDYAGDDSWVSASGKVLVEVALEGMEGLIYPTRYVRAQVSDLDVLFQDGFE